GVAGAEIGVDHAGDPPRPEGPRLFERKRRREAVAVLRRIGKDLPAGLAGIDGLIEVVERRRSTDRDPGELNERPVRVEADGSSVGAVVVHTDLEIAAKDPVFGLLPAVEPRIGAGPHVEVSTVGSVLVAGAAGASNREGNGAGGARLEWPVCEIIGGLTSDISARTEAHTGA